LPFPTKISQCLNGGWKKYGFKGPLQCIIFVLLHQCKPGDKWSATNTSGKCIPSGGGGHGDSSVSAQLARYIHPTSEGGVALVALVVGMLLFGLGLVFPRRRRGRA